TVGRCFVLLRGRLHKFRRPAASLDHGDGRAHLIRFATISVDGGKYALQHAPRFVAGDVTNRVLLGKGDADTIGVGSENELVDDLLFDFDRARESAFAGLRTHDHTVWTARCDTAKETATAELKCVK